MAVEVPEKIMPEQTNMTEPAPQEPSLKESRSQEAMQQESLQEIGRNNRVGVLDLLRGFAIIFVMTYHLLYDLIFFGRIDIPFFFSGTMDIIHNFFLIILFSVSGICAGFSKNVLKRGAVLFLLGEMLTLATAAFVPDELIVFGVLSCFGASMLIYGVISPVMKRVPQAVVFAVFALLSVVFWNFSRTESLNLVFTSVHLDLPKDALFLYPIGITSYDFHSADYFPLLPFGFIFLAGTALSDIFKNRRLPEVFYKARLPVVNFLGKYSLWAYIIHQPVFLGLTYIIFR
ncbi:MAG: DUF1624 domain-containing protein [Oscillospiraceae bacterium]|nr:DUF1624 domain-containing protein [Oscillospiraceae bacterium]